jgi:hypothetical protein
MPTFEVHVGDTIENGPPQWANYAPAEPIVYPGAPDSSRDRRSRNPILSGTEARRRR